MMNTPCEWPVSYAQCNDIETFASDPASGNFEVMAAEYLWRWTGMRLGVCEVTILPCRRDCMEGVSTFFGSGPYTNGGFGGPWRPVVIDGLWYNVGCRKCGDTCGCLGAAPLRLPGPVESVVGVWEDGDLLDPSGYHVENHKWLVRTDGGTWDSCGLQITYNRGVSVPVGGQIAAGLLAVELAKAACGDSSCGLPQRLQTITRQGVTVAMLDSFDDIDKGHTGIWLIDSWVASMTKTPAQSRVYSPDLKRGPRRITS